MASGESWVISCLNLEFFLDIIQAFLLTFAPEKMSSPPISCFSHTQALIHPGTNLTVFHYCALQIPLCLGWSWRGKRRGNDTLFRMLMQSPR